MKVTLQRKVHGEQGLNGAGEYHVWMIAHLEMCCPQCGSVQEFLRPGMTVKEWEPLTIDGECICPSCGVTFTVRKNRAFIGEPPLPPLDPKLCFVCERNLYVAGAGPVHSVGLPPCCRTCTDQILRRDPETIRIIEAKAQDYEMTIRL